MSNVIIQETSLSGLGADEWAQWGSDANKWGVSPPPLVTVEGQVHIGSGWAPDPKAFDPVAVGGIAGVAVGGILYFFGMKKTGLVVAGLGAAAEAAALVNKYLLTKKLSLPPLPASSQGSVPQGGVSSYLQPTKPASEWKWT